MDPFVTLGLPRRFALDVKQAENRHLDLSRTLHPDRYVKSPSAERRMALSRAIEVNEAWRTIRDPIHRAEAVLRLEGLGNEIGQTREPKPDAAFLMEVLETRERLEEARAEKNRASVHAILAEAKKQHAEAMRALGDAIDAGLGDTAKLRAAIPLLGRLRYAARFLDEAIAADDELSGF
jgi:molecular chaperone HscB